MKTNPNEIIKEVKDILQIPPMAHESGSIGFIDKMIIAEILFMLQPLLVIETGTFKGQTTRFLSDFTKMNQLNNCKIASFDLPNVISTISTDPYFNNLENVEFIAGSLPNSLSKFLEKTNQPVDFAIVDASHTYDAVYTELEQLGKYLRFGGYLFCHDYRDRDPKYEGVVYAVDRFARKNKYGLLPLRESNEVWGSALLYKPWGKRSKLKGLTYHIKMKIRCMLKMK